MTNSKKFFYLGCGLLAFALSACDGFNSGGGGSSSSTGSGGGGNEPNIPESCSTTAVVNWTAPTTNTNGSPLLDLAGFKVYHGPASRSYPTMINIANATVTSHTLTNLPHATYYFAVTAYNTNPNPSLSESDYSNEAVIRLVACMVNFIHMNLVTKEVTHTATPHPTKSKSI